MDLHTVRAEQPKDKQLDDSGGGIVRVGDCPASRLPTDKFDGFVVRRPSFGVKLNSSEIQNCAPGVFPLRQRRVVVGQSRLFGRCGQA